jgi:hypothetical protein
MQGSSGIGANRNEYMGFASEVAPLAFVIPRSDRDEESETFPELRATADSSLTLWDDD